MKSLPPVKLEVPMPWLVAGDGPYHRQMWSTLCRALAKLRLTASFEETWLGRERIARMAPVGGFALSYHSIGEVPNVWRIKESAVPNYYLFDRSGYSGWAEIARYPERFADQIDAVDLAAARQFVTGMREEFLKTNISKYRQSPQAFKVEQPFVFFPLQKLRDTVARLYRLDALKVLERAVVLAEKNKKLLLVKRHPLCREPAMAEALERISHGHEYVQLTTASVHRILDRCDAVLVANSGVGFEALIHGKPVYAFGDSEYTSVAARIDHLDDVGRVFSRAHEVDADSRDRFLTYFHQQYCFSSLDIDTLLPKLHRAMEECDTRDRRSIWRRWASEVRGRLHKSIMASSKTESES